jgi:hypothetical protein
MAKSQHKPNKLFRDARERLFDSRQALAEAANAHLPMSFLMNANDIGKIERGVVTYPRPQRRAVLRMALQVATDAEIGFFDRRQPSLDRPDEPCLGSGMLVHQGVSGPLISQDHQDPTSNSPISVGNSPASARDVTLNASRRLLAANLLAGTHVVVQQVGATPHDGSADQELTLESTLEPLERLAALTDASFTDGKIEQVDQLLREIIRVYEGEGPRRVVPTIVRQRARLTRALSGFERPRHKQAIYRHSAMLAGMLAYAAVNLGKFAVAKAYCAESFGLAEFVEIDDLRAWVRGTESFCAYYEGDYHRAAELARDGRRFAKDGPQAIRLLVNGEARALAKLGDRDGTDRAVEGGLALAARHGRRGGMSPCMSFDAYSDARTISNAVTAYTSLGLPGKVNELLQELTPVVDASDSVWSKSLVRLDRAQVLLKAKEPEPEEAADLAVQALTISAERPVASILIRAREVHTSAAPWKHLDGVRRLTVVLAESERR